MVDGVSTDTHTYTAADPIHLSPSCPCSIFFFFLFRDVLWDWAIGVTICLVVIGIFFSIVMYREFIINQFHEPDPFAMVWLLPPTSQPLRLLLLLLLLLLVVVVLLLV